MLLSAIIWSYFSSGRDPKCPKMLLEQSGIESEAATHPSLRQSCHCTIPMRSTYAAFDVAFALQPYNLVTPQGERNARIFLYNYLPQGRLIAVGSLYLLALSPCYQ